MQTPAPYSIRRLSRFVAAFTAALAFMSLGPAGCGSGTSSSYFLTPGLTDAKAALVVAGMDVSAVESTIGAPHQRVRFDNLKATAWDYRYIDSWGYMLDFSVMIGDDGKVINKVSARAYADNR